MAPLLGLSLGALRPRGGPVEAAHWPPRPAGPLVWLHVAGSDPAPGAEELARRIADEDGVALIVTGPTTGPVSLSPPEETPQAIRAFLDHFRPDLFLASDGGLRPALMQELRLRHIPALLADARAPSMMPGHDSWFSGPLRRSLAGFSYIGAVDASAAGAFRKAGALPETLAVVGRLEERSAALPCLEAERASIAHLLATRPVWLAACVAEGEETAILAAHRRVLGHAHRLLLILLPADPSRATPLAEQLEQDGWTVALRSAEQEPDPGVEVYVVDSPAELGLWYRLAPITFLGGSLSGTGAARNPMEPAALGSAILHGPRPGAFGAMLGRLGAARAARAVASSGDLAEALGDLLSPDRAARLAQAAWAVASDGAEATDAILTRIRALMDRPR